MSSNTNIGNTPVNQGYVQLIHMGETGGIDGTLRALYDGDGTASDLLIASDKVKISTELYIGSKTLTEFVQDTVGAMLTTGSYTNITTTYDDTNGNIDLNASGDVTLSNSVTLSNKTLAAPILTGTTQGASITLSGDLTVNGTTTTVNQTNLDVSDNIIGLNRGAGSNANDSGIIIERGSTGNNAAIIWDESADKFTLGTTTSTPSATGDLTISTGTLVANLEGAVTGNVTGSASLNLLKSNNLSDLASASTARTNLGVDAAGTDNSTNVTLAGSLDYITLSGQQITRNAIDLTTDVTGVLPSANLDADTAHLSGTQTFSGAKTFSSSITLGGHSFDDIDIGSEFVDADDHIMSAGAIKEKIENYGYTTNVGDITGVDLTSGVGITISSETNTTSGAYSSTIATNIASTSLNVSGTGQLAINLNKSALSTATLNASDFMILFDADASEAPKRFIAQDIFDSLGGITIDGTTANGLLTYGGTNNIDTESALTFDGSTLALTGDLNVGSGDFFVDDSTGRTGIGTASPEGKLHIYQSDAGVAPHGDGDDLVLESNADTGISILSGEADGETGAIIFGSQNDSFGAALQYNYYENRLKLYTANSGHSLIFATDNNTTAMTIDSSQRVGIGTTSPSEKLDVVGSAEINGLLYVSDSNDIPVRLSSTDAGFAISMADSNSASATHNRIGVTTNDMTFHTNNAEAMRIDSSQRVGIGTTSPAHKLDVLSGSARFYSTGATELYIGGAGAGHHQGAIVFSGTATDASYRGQGMYHHDAASDIEYFTGTLYANDAWAVTRKTSTSSHDTSVAQGSHALFIIEGGGDVGIGVASPAHKLDVNGGIRNYANGSAVFRTESTAAGYGAYNRLTTTTNAYDLVSLNGDFKIDESGVATRLIIKDSTGRVGIGTASPSQPLHTHGTAGDTRTRISTSNHGTMFESGVTSDSAGILLVSGHAQSILNVYLQGAGGVQNQFRFTHNGDFVADEDIVAYSTAVGSDIKLKKNVKDISYGLKDVLDIRAVEFDWKEKRDGKHDIGFIAQEIEKIIPEVVKEVDTLNTDGETHKVVDYAKLTSVLMKAIQEQQDQINELKGIING